MMSCCISNGKSPYPKYKLDHRGFSPQHLWSFDESDGRMIYDQIGQINGKIVGVIERVDGHIGTGALRFSGKKSHILFNNIPALRLNIDKQSQAFGENDEKSDEVHKGARSVRLWIKKRKGKQPNAVIAQQGKGDEPIFQLAFNEKGDGHGLRVQLGNIIWQCDTLKNPINAEVWTQLAITYNGQLLRVFIDGSLEPLTKKGKLRKGDDTGKFSLGAKPNGKQSFVGDVDRLEIFDFQLQGFKFLHPKSEINIADYKKSEENKYSWYKGKALAIRFAWNDFIHHGGHTAREAGSRFDAEKFAETVKSSGACGVMIKMHSTATSLFPTRYFTADVKPTVDYVDALAKELDKRGLWMGANLSRGNIDKKAELLGISKEAAYYALVDEILERYPHKFYQFRFDAFFRPGIAFNPEDYNHKAVFDLIHSKKPEALINFNRYTGKGAADMSNTEIGRPAEGARYWEQEDFKEFRMFRKNDKPHEIEATVGDMWGMGTNVVALPTKNLLNMVSSCSAMGITTVLSLGPNIEGDFAPEQIIALEEIGYWLTPRKPYLDDMVPDFETKLNGYKGMWYVNQPKNIKSKQRIISLLSGSRRPVKLPGVVKLLRDDVKEAHLLPCNKPIPVIRKGGVAYLDLNSVSQDEYNTMILLKLK